MSIPIPTFLHPHFRPLLASASCKSGTSAAFRISSHALADAKWPLRTCVSPGYPGWPTGSPAAIRNIFVAQIVRSTSPRGERRDRRNLLSALCKYSELCSEWTSGVDSFQLPVFSSPLRFSSSPAPPEVVSTIQT